MTLPQFASTLRRALPLVLALVAAGATPAVAAQGSDPDRTFGGDGRVITDLGAAEEAEDVARQADGKLVVVGRRGDLFAIARYHPSGALDRTFSGDGKLLVDATGGVDSARSVAVQGDGKIVVAGAGSDGARSNGRFALIRLNPDGSLDPTFSGDGRLALTFGASRSEAEAVTVAPDGAVVAAGFAANEPGQRGFAAIRLRPDGTLDPLFSGDGRQTVDFPAAGDERARDLVLQPDGGVVLAGDAGGDLALARLSAGGSPDTTFGSGGRVSTDFGGQETGGGVALQADGRIVVAGGSDNDTYDFELRRRLQDFAIARFNADGTLDPSFSDDGRQIVDIQGRDNRDRAEDLLVQPDGRIVAAGRSDSVDTDADGDQRLKSSVLAVARLNADGSPDTTSFSPDGTVGYRLPAGLFDRASAVVRQADGKLVVAGTRAGNGPADFALLRLAGTGTVSYADLEIVDASAPDSVRRDQRYALTVAMRNRGPRTAPQASVNLNLLSGQRLVGGSPGCRTPYQGAVSCPVGSLAAGATARVGITVELTRDRANATAYGLSRFADPDHANDARRFRTSVTPAGPAKPPCPMIGSAGDDIIYGTSAPNTVCAFEGDDLLIGEGDDDILRGGSGADRLRGGPGSDRLFGEGGNDLLDGLDGVRGNDFAAGGGGADVCRSDAGDRRSGCE